MEKQTTEPSAANSDERVGLRLQHPPLVKLARFNQCQSERMLNLQDHETVGRWIPTLGDDNAIEAGVLNHSRFLGGKNSARLLLFKLDVGHSLSLFVPKLRA